MQNRTVIVVESKHAQVLLEGIPTQNFGSSPIASINHDDNDHGTMVILDIFSPVNRTALFCHCSYNVPMPLVNKEATINTPLIHKQILTTLFEVNIHKLFSVLYLSPGIMRHPMAPGHYHPTPSVEAGRYAGRLLRSWLRCWL